MHIRIFDNTDQVATALGASHRRCLARQAGRRPWPADRPHACCDVRGAAAASCRRRSRLLARGHVQPRRIRRRRRRHIRAASGSSWSSTCSRPSTSRRNEFISSTAPRLTSTRSASVTKRQIEAAGGTRPADPRHRHQRSHRLQRARRRARVAHASRDARRDDASRQRGAVRRRPSRVPREALSMGMGTILKAATLILVAMGERKARCIERTISGPLTPHLPRRSCSCTATPSCTSTVRPRR